MTGCPATACVRRTADHLGRAERSGGGDGGVYTHLLPAAETRAGVGRRRGRRGGGRRRPGPPLLHFFAERHISSGESQGFARPVPAREVRT